MFYKGTFEKRKAFWEHTFS